MNLCLDCGKPISRAAERCPECAYRKQWGSQDFEPVPVEPADRVRWLMEEIISRCQGEIS
jgi:hypothetical protein